MRARHALVVGALSATHFAKLAANLTLQTLDIGAVGNARADYRLARGGGATVCLTLAKYFAGALGQPGNVRHFPFPSIASPIFIIHHNCCFVEGVCADVYLPRKNSCIGGGGDL